MDLSVNGAKVYFVFFEGSPFELRITQTTISLFTVTLLLIGLAFLVTRKISKRPGKVQVLVEKAVNMLYGLVVDTMG